MTPSRILLSAPQLSGLERELAASSIRDDESSGENIQAFEAGIAELCGVHALAVSSSHAARQLALRHVGIGAGDFVAISTTAFIGAVTPITELGAIPTLIDCDVTSGSMDAARCAEYLSECSRSSKLPKAIVVTHRYGQHADVDAIVAAADPYAVPVIEDASESLGATYRGRQTGTSAALAILNFGDDKIITAAGGGMVVSRSAEAIAEIRRRASPPFAGVDGLITEISYDCLMNDVLAGVGRAQLQVLGERVAARQRVAAWYANALADVDGLSLQPEAPWGTHSRWMTVFLLDPDAHRATPAAVVQGLDDDDIEGSRLQRPMHLEPAFASFTAIGGTTAESLFARGFCLPSSSAITVEEQQRVVASVRRTLGATA